MNTPRRRLWQAAARAALASLAIWSTAAPAADTVLIIADGADSGFNDPTPVAPVGGNTGETLGAQRRIAFRHAAAVLGSRVGSAVPIRIQARFDDALTCDRSAATLGSAGPASFAANFDGAPRADTFYAVALANALRGRRVANTDIDIVGRFNARLDSDPDCLGRGWYYGIDGDAPDRRPSFVSTVKHELIHGLGFVSLVALAPSDDSSAGQFSRSSSGARYPDIFSRFIQDLSFAGQPFWPELSDAQREQSLTHAPDVVFAGPSTTANAAPTLRAGTSQGRVRLFTPDPIERASSVSHWDSSLDPEQIMQPITARAFRVMRGIGISACALQDIGWRLINNTRCPDVSERAILGAANGDDVAVEQPSDSGPALESPASRDSSSGGGGCTLASGARFDPLWALLLIGAAGLLLRRRYRA